MLMGKRDKVAVAQHGVPGPPQAEYACGNAQNTVRVVVAVTELKLAVMVAVPVPVVVRSPEVFTTPTFAFVQPQFTQVLMSWVLPSLKVPMAVICWLLPRLREGFCGVMESETRVALFTFSAAEARVELSTAEIRVQPVVSALTWPPLVVLPTVATAELDDVQCAMLVTFCTVPSL